MVLDSQLVLPTPSGNPELSERLKQVYASSNYAQEIEEARKVAKSEIEALTANPIIIDYNRKYESTIRTNELTVLGFGVGFFIAPLISSSLVSAYESCRRLRRKQAPNPQL